MTTDTKQAADLKSLMARLPREELEHMRRVGIYAGALAQYLLRREGLMECGCMLKAAAYHDIGKAWISRDILLKPGRLTDGEMDILRSHPLHAKEWFEERRAAGKLDKPVSLLEPAYQCAVYHHEWFHGGGYPFGLAGDEIPFAARITAVCDAYDAMTSDRVYRKAHTHQFACHELDQNAGTQFDPDIVQVFLKHEAVFSQLAGRAQATAAARETPAMIS